MKKVSTLNRTSSKPKPLNPGSGGLTPLKDWDWGNPKAILARVASAYATMTTDSHVMPYDDRNARFRRIVYRVGRAGLEHPDYNRFFSNLYENKKGRGRRSTDIFVALLQSVSGLTGAGLSKANINKTAATMRVAHEWDIHWRFYGLVADAVGAGNMSGTSRTVVKRPKWADGLTRKAQRPTERMREKKTAAKKRSTG